MPTSSPSLPPSSQGDWLPLGAASRLLGVDPDTLRRWADEGRVKAFATPGGHRRFARRSLDRLIAARRTGNGRSLAALGATPDRLSAAYRRGYSARRTGGPDPRASVPAADHELYRDHGRRLVAALIRHLDTDAGPEHDRAEADALALTADLGERLAASGVGLDEAVALFVAARRPFLSELGSIARRRELDTARVTALYDAASSLLDRLLLRLVASHAATASHPPGAVVAPAGAGGVARPDGHAARRGGP